MMIYKQIHHLMNDYDFSKREKVNFYGMLIHKAKMTTNSITQRNYKYCIEKFWHDKVHVFRPRSFMYLLNYSISYDFF